MRSKKFTYTLAAASATAFATGLTGAGPFTTFAAQTDGTAHQTTLTSAAVLNGINMTIVGTDANGNVQREVIAGPNANTINLAKYYKSITSITAASTLGANTMNVGITALVQTPYYVTDFAKLTGPNVVVGVGGTITYTAQQTNDNIFDLTNTPVWATLGTAGSTTSLSNMGSAGTTAIRVTVASHTSGVLSVIITQARV